MEAIVANQQQLLAGIEQLYTNFKKDGAERKSKDYIRRRLETLENYWKEFQANHVQLCGFGVKGHVYFTNNQYDLAKDRYETVKSVIENYHAESRPTTPILKPATPISVPGTSLQFPTPQSRGTHSKTEELLRKQKSNFRAFQRAVSMINLDSVAEKWELEDMLNMIQARWSVVDSLHWELDSELEETNQEYENAYSNYEQIYYNIKKGINSKMWSQSYREKSTPVMDIPTFSGNYHSWVSFKDLFLETIHNNNSLSKAQKMQFLKSKLRGEAEKLIQHLHISSENYDVSWDILNHRFNNKKLIFNSHMSILFGLPTLQHQSAAAIKKIHDTSNECLNAVKNLGVDISTWDPIIVYILSQKLDVYTHNDYIESLNNPRDLPSLEGFMRFLEGKFTSLESSKRKQDGKSYYQQDTPTSIKMEKTHFFKSFNINQKQKNNPNKIFNTHKCPVCKLDHGIFHCNTFLQYSPDMKQKTVNKLSLCKNCLYNHNGNKCYSNKRCRKCQGDHNTLLHDTLGITHGTSSTNNAISHVDKKLPKHPENSTNTLMENSGETLLATAQVKIKAADGTYQTMRALIDQGSQTTLISENAAQRLKLPRRHCKGIIFGVGARESNCKGVITITLSSIHDNNYTLHTDAFVMNHLVNNLPNKSFAKPSWSYIENLQLADPEFYISTPIDILLGVDIYSSILQAGIVKDSDAMPVAQQTRFGWILCGSVKSYQCNVVKINIEDIQKFWTIEDVAEDINMSTEDHQCVQLYESSTIRLPDGRYVVRLPMHSDAHEKLGLSRPKAVAQFHQLEHKFDKQQTMASEYKAFINEYINLGHMHRARVANTRTYYLPHHCVQRAESTTTSLRVVFNASQKTTTGFSLNDVMYRGPNLQKDLLSLILKWRLYPYVFTADIEKMFRQIMIHPDDKHYQQIVWRDSPDQTLQDYQLATVTYGTKSAPFLAMMTLKRLATDERHHFPNAARVLEEQFYMDDLLSGEFDITSAKQLQANLISLLKTGGFNLRKWSSNDLKLLENFDTSVNQGTFDFKYQDSTKTLGLTWRAKLDTFTFECKISEQSANLLTKRKLLAEISKIFDPLGWLAPVTLKCKLLFQNVWLIKLRWDENIPDFLHREWLKLRAEIININQVAIPRWVGSGKHDCIQLHGFCDASTKAYACVVYSRIQQNDKGVVTLLAAKTKLVPVSKSNDGISLPRLELSGAYLLSKLMSKVLQSFGSHKTEIYGWCDSTAVLGWLQGEPNRWKPFVANRVKKITEIMSSSCWRYIKSDENPADCASRGLTVKQLKEHALWWSGPSWLSSSNYLNKSVQTIYNTNLDIKQSYVSTTNDASSSIIIAIISKHSSFTRATRVLAWILRALTRNKTKPSYLTVTELQTAKQKIIRQVQLTEFSEDINDLESKSNVKSSSKLISLNPFLDSQGLVRVGGRLRNSNISDSMKYPIIIPHNGRLTDLLIDLAHRSTFHGGARLTLSWLRQEYWLIGGNRAVKKRLRLCVLCKKHNPNKSTQLMGDLPEARTNPTRPFYHTGVDYTGCIDIKSSKGRGIKCSKGYVAVFVCMVTKAIHLELVSDLSSSSFLAALRRLAARRGSPRHLYSDNGTNFVGANKIISKEFDIASILSNDFYTEISEMKIEWHFNAPSWPSAGGLWEAAVRSMKYHLKRVVGDQKLTYEEFSTILSQLEACLNTRPLCAISEDPDDINYLTPSHFLASGPQLTIIRTEKDARTRWQLTEKIFQDTWKRWRAEYLSQLSSRSKWQTPQANINIDDIVIIHDAHLPPGKWALGRVVDLHPGKDGYVRVVSVKTKNGIFKRPVIKLSILPTSYENKDQPKNDAVPKRVEKSKTKSTKIKGFSLTSLMYLFMFLIAFISDTRGAYNITKLQSNQAIYFDKINNMQIIKDDWTLIVYYNMDPYWTGFKTFDKYLKYLDHICANIKGGSHCSDVLSFLRHDHMELQHNNQMLLSQQLKARARTRRGLINGVGYLANSLFGVLDERFAQKYEQDIDLIKGNQDHLALLWKNQTSVIEAESNLLKRMETVIEKHHKLIHQKLLGIENSVTILKDTLQDNSLISDFTMTSFIAKDILNNLKHIQDNLLNTVTNIYNGKVNFHLISPDQLWHELNIISGQVPKDYSLPVGNTDFAEIYNLMKIRTRIMKQYILFEIKIPLLGRDSFEIFHMIPIPHKVGNQKMIHVLPISEYAAISLKGGTYLSMTDYDVSTCFNLGIERLLCHTKTPEYRMTDDAAMCKTEIEASGCATTEKTCNERMTALHKSGSYLYFCCSECRMNVICGDQVTSLHLTNAGLLTVGHGCLIKSNEYSIFTHHQGQSKTVIEPDVLTPDINQINHIINISLPDIKINVLNDTNNAETHKRLLLIEDQVQIMKQQVPIINRISDHDIHHYTMTYVILVIVGLIGITLALRRFRKYRQKKSSEGPAVQPGVTFSRHHGDSESVISVVSDNTISASVDKATSPIVSKSVSFKEFDSN